MVHSSATRRGVPLVVAGACNAALLLALLHCGSARTGVEDASTPSPSPGGDGAVGADVGPREGGVDHAMVGLAAIAAGRAHTCAVTLRGEVWCWGDNTYAQLGRAPSLVASSVPVRVELDDVVALRVVAGDDHSCVLAQNDVVYCWGRNQRGQLGRPASALGEAARAPLPSSPALHVVALSAGADNSCVGYQSAEMDAGADAGAEVLARYACWGDNTHAQLTRVDVDHTTTPVELRRDDGPMLGRALALGHGFFLANLRDQTTLRAHAWGRILDGDAQDGGDDLDAGADGAALDADVDTDAAPASTPQAIVLRDLDANPLEDVRALAAGDDHACALAVPADAGSRVWCWGHNEHGQLGRAGAGHPAPQPLQAFDPSGTKWLRTGRATTCVMTPSGLYCAGRNDRGQLGRGRADDAVHAELAPVELLDGNVSELALGAEHACAIVGSGAAGRAYCWGANDVGQLGDGMPLGVGYIDSADDPFQRPLPVAVVTE